MEFIRRTKMCEVDRRRQGKFETKKKKKITFLRSQIGFAVRNRIRCWFCFLIIGGGGLTGNTRYGCKISQPGECVANFFFFFFFLSNYRNKQLT